VRLIDPLPFFAVSALFHETRAVDPPRLPEEPERLLELALAQHVSFRAVNLDPVPVEQLKGAAVLQFYVLAALCDLNARPLFQAAHDPGVATALLYAEMIRRLLALTRQGQTFECRPPRFYLQPLGVTFRRLAQPFQAEVPDAGSLPVVQQHCAEYLNYLAFALYRLQHLPVTA
jgi:hypothetical protein